MDGLPNEQLLDDLETNQGEIHDTEEKIRNIQAQIDAVQPSFVQIRERIAAANLAIEKLDLDKKMVEAEIEKIPPQEAVDQLSKKLSTIETTEKQLGSLWKKNAKKLTLEFEPTKEPEKVKPVLERASVDLAIARQDNQALHQEIERVTVLASARGASKEFYEKSLVQIQEASKCPICRGELLDKASIEERINGEARSSETDEKELEVKVKALRTEYDSRETRITGFLDQLSSWSRWTPFAKSISVFSGR